MFSSTHHEKRFKKWQNRMANNCRKGWPLVEMLKWLTASVGQRQKKQITDSRRKIVVDGCIETVANENIKVMSCSQCKVLGQILAIANLSVGKLVSLIVVYDFWCNSK